MALESYPGLACEIERETMILFILFLFSLLLISILIILLPHIQSIFTVSMNPNISQIKIRDITDETSFSLTFSVLSFRQTEES